VQRDASCVARLIHRVKAGTQGAKASLPRERKKERKKKKRKKKKEKGVTVTAFDTPNRTTLWTDGAVTL